MNISRLFRRSPESAARTLAIYGAPVRKARERKHVHDVCDAINAKLGRPAVEWAK